MIYKRLFDLPTWGPGRPFEELDRLRRQVTSLFDILSEGTLPFSRSGVFPLINLTEDTDNFYLRAELPGVAAGDLDIQAVDNGISISGERKIATEHKDAKYHRRERDAGTFSRMVTLPSDIDVDNVKASLANGILTVTIPKAEDAKPRQITIN